ncbi:hypothetical protein AGMMS50262_23220 [Bacteroidia bacterium]|nr:hypothetical protein AGMMS50262_23220 [Bacteroidia bacterium]GHU75073.1 hypothetical protein FACS189413_19710 [Bacteroidia bacterium]
MTLTQEFLIDILNLIKGDNLYCYLATSFDNLIDSIKNIEAAVINGNYNCSFHLNDVSKKILIDNVVKYHSEEYVHNFEIKEENEPLFLAFDGFEIANIASKIKLSESFIEKYVRTELCIVWDKIIYPHEQLKHNIRPTRIMY